MTPKLKKDFLSAMSGSLSAYYADGARSTKKLHPAHGGIAKILQQSLGTEYDIKALGIGDNKEEKITGKYYDKRVDIAVSKNDKTLAVTSFKFVTSNYAQNNINYFENMLGETVNIRRMGCSFAYIMVLRKNMPYLNHSGKPTKKEKITKRQLLCFVLFCWILTRKIKQGFVKTMKI